MNNMKPNYTDLGLSTPMGPLLRNTVERLLVDDLIFYSVDKKELRFDWSESCIEGHDTEYLDGSLENYSGVSVFDNRNVLVADGWMEFVHAGSFFLAYWEFVTTWDNGKKLKEKTSVGIPDHIWEQIPDDIKPNFDQERMGDR